MRSNDMTKTGCTASIPRKSNVLPRTASLEQVHKLTGIAPKEAYVDRGYRGHGVTDTVRVWMTGARQGVTVAIKKKLKRRSAVEPVIGHMKNDGRRGRNFLKGAAGDAMNALLCGTGYKLTQDAAPVGAFVGSFRYQS